MTPPIKNSYCLSDDAANNGYGTAIVGTVSGTSISFGSPVVFQSAAVSMQIFQQYMTPLMVK